MSVAADGAARVVAVVVAFAPDAERFASLVAATRSQVAAIVVVDNASGAGLERVDPAAELERVDMRGNAGVAAAQNAGIERARALGATHVLLLDHDSVPAADMTARLLAASAALRAGGERVAAVGADYRDDRHAAPSPFVAMGRFGFRRVVAAPGDAVVPVPFLIGAGSLIALDALDAVGAMEERLFIDYVDIEWCLRAARLGWRCYGVPGARMAHRLGDDVLAVRAGGPPLRWLGRTVPTRSPQRHYYLFRNGCWLMLHGALPLRWKLHEARRLLLAFGTFGLFAARRREQVSAMARGTLDGMRGRMGPAGGRASSAP